MAKNATFVPLHTKSDRTAGCGTASVAELVRAAATRGCEAVALTDIENLYGQIELHHAARAAGLRAITGVELRRGFDARTLGEKSGRLVLLARDREGYESLCRIVTARRSTPGKTPDPLSCLAEEPRGIFFLTDDADVIDALLARGVSPEDVRFLLVRPGVSARAPSGVRVVADVDAVMIERSDHALHALLAAIRKAPVEPPERAWSSWDDAPFDDMPEALAETRRVAEACTLDLCEARRIVRARDGDADAELARACALMRRRGSAYDARIERELGVIRALGLPSYFMVVKEITDHARASNIAFAGRGSSASSLVCHALGITAIDPIENGLHFERFVHARRLEPPDIDLDFPSNRRSEIVDWVFRRFGRDRVAMISTHQTFQRRAAFREGLAAFGMRREDIERFSADDASLASTAALPHHLQPHVPTIERLVGKLQHVSVHPGGVVITSDALVKHAPLERAPKGILVTQYDARSVAKLGLLKIDLLGNRALAALEACILQTKVRDLEGGDAETTALLREGRTIGCFQVETAATRSLLRKIPVNGARELATVLALVRPGPSSGDAKAAYVRGLDVPLLFEEDILSRIATLAKVSLEEADVMRAEIVAADDDPAALAPIERAFLARAPGREDAWRELARFAAYSFNRAHALSYADLAWRMVAMKARHPTELACAVLSHYGGAYPLRTVAAAFAREGVRILRPDVNLSEEAHAVQSGAVRIGLGAIKHVTKKTVRTLLAGRPFVDMRDLLARAAPAKRELRALVLCGACDDLAPLASRAYPIAHEDLLGEVQRDPTLARFVTRAAGGPRADVYRALVRVQNEVAFLEMHPSDHPLRILRDEARDAGAIPIDALASLVGRPVRIAGIVAASRRIETRANRTMQFVTMEDDTGIVEVVLFPGVYASLGDPVTNAGPFLVEGVVAGDHGDITLEVTRVTPFHGRPAPYRRSA